jgi:hypothetical protein
MRRVEIVEDPQSQRCWVALDLKSGEPVMRLAERPVELRSLQNRFNVKRFAHP